MLKNINPDLKIYVIYKPNKTNPEKDKELEKRYIETFGKKVKPIFRKISFKEYFSDNKAV